MPRTYRFMIADVFTDIPFAGNQLGVFTNATGLTDSEMQMLAAELGFSECTFVLPPEGDGDIDYVTLARLIGDIDESGTHLRHAGDHYQQMGITLQRGRAVALDTEARSIKLDDGSSLGYDRLLIATGSSPATPPIPGVAGPGVHSCWTLADARAIMAKAAPGARVLQMGAGFIGCIIMEALAARGVKLTVVEMGDRMVPRMMGPTAGGMIKAWCQKKGVAVHTGARVEAIEREWARRYGQ